ncbi:hypothetical protein K2Y00_03635 [Patescibacteria group bacterium]|nr:hypothetical protein [Patescibacteria group bacterium]
MESTKPNSLVVAAGVIILIVLLVLAVAYLPFLSGVKSWWDVVTAPAAVKEVGYLGLEDGKGVVYTVGMFGIHTRSFEGMSVIDYVAKGSSQVAVLKSGDVYDVYDVSSSEPVKLTTDGRQKDSLDISSDGLKVVYGVKVRATTFAGAGENDQIYNLPDWEVHEIDMLSRTSRVVGPGNHPRFYADGILYPAPAGFVYRVAGDNGIFDALDTWSIYPDVMAYRVLRLPVLTDAGLMAFPSVATSAYDAVSVTSVAPLAFAAAPDAPIDVPPGTYDLMIRGDHEYVLLQGARGAVVAKLTDGAMRQVFTFPASYAPQRFAHIR